MERLCFGLSIHGLEPVLDYLDYVTDIPGFHPRYVSHGDNGYMRGELLACLSRYVGENPGTKKCGLTEEQMLDTWIKSKIGNA